MIYIQKISSFETEATAGPTIIEEEKKKRDKKNGKRYWNLHLPQLIHLDSSKRPPKPLPAN